MPSGDDLTALFDGECDSSLVGHAFVTVKAKMSAVIRRIDRNHNRTLVSLNISWNKFIEDQSMVLTDQHIEQGLTEVPLS